MSPTRGKRTSSSRPPTGVTSGSSARYGPRPVRCTSFCTSSLWPAAWSPGAALLDAGAEGSVWSLDLSALALSENNGAPMETTPATVAMERKLGTSFLCPSRQICDLCPVGSTSRPSGRYYGDPSSRRLDMSKCGRQAAAENGWVQNQNPQRRDPGCPSSGSSQGSTREAQ